MKEMLQTFLRFYFYTFISSFRMALRNPESLQYHRGLEMDFQPMCIWYHVSKQA